ncbi:hypothetical protein Hanom_Chr15g01378601 [Helianthus anomalus]
MLVSNFNRRKKSFFFFFFFFFGKTTSMKLLRILLRPRPISGLIFDTVKHVAEAFITNRLI